MNKQKNLIAKLLSNASIVSHFLPYLFTMGMSSQEQNAGGAFEAKNTKVNKNTYIRDSVHSTM